MFKSFLNNLYIKIWSGQKKVGPHKNVLLKRSCESFGDTVYDLRWSLKYIHKNGETSHTVTLTERASKWNLTTEGNRRPHPPQHAYGLKVFPR